MAEPAFYPKHDDDDDDSGDNELDKGNDGNCTRHSKTAKDSL